MVVRMKNKKFGDFIEKNKTKLIIIASVLFLLGFIGAILNTYCEGVVKTIGLIAGLIFLSIGVIIFCLLGIRAERRGKKQKIADGDETDKRKAPRRKLDKFDKIMLSVIIVSAILCFCSVFMILCEIVAVRIAGIVLTSFFGLVLIICSLLLKFIIDFE